MIVKVADNILSPLGMSTEENYRSVRQGLSELRLHEGLWDIPEPFVASLFDRGRVNDMAERAGIGTVYTFFEKLLILSARKALEQTDVDPASSRTIFIVSTTKGNVDLLESPGSFSEERLFLSSSARELTRYFRNPNTPLVVSNACISGVSAQIAAMRCLESLRYDHAVVVGADCQSKFIVSGFQSFKALSHQPCRPFDAERCGLNLGEAAATLILSREDEPLSSGGWMLSRGAIRNDANHISGPSRTGEGSYLALKAVLEGEEPAGLAFINAHGTATPYNDEMESIAIGRASLEEVPVNGLKGCYGHTMGAAGVLETLISMAAVDDHTVLATRGYEHCGVSCPLSVSGTHRATDKSAFVKQLSGFGGCNAAVLWKKGGGL